jgi:hypothetical protein
MPRVAVLISAVSMLLLLGVFSASTPTSQFQCANGQIPILGGASFGTIIQNSLSTGLSLSAIGLLLSVMILAIAYMASHVIETSGIREWISTEYVEITKTLIIIAGIYFLLSMLGSIAILLTGSPASAGSSIQSSTINLLGVANSANSYLCNSQIDMAKYFSSVIGISQGIELLNSVNIDWIITVPVLAIVFGSGVAYLPISSSLLSVNPFNPGAVPYSSFFNDLLSFVILPVMYIISAEAALLPLLVSLGLVVLIPMGIVFRALPFTRPIGGTLIAIGIGLAIIFPAVLAIFNNSVISFIGGYQPPQSQNMCTTATSNWLTQVFIDLWCNLQQGPLASISEFGSGFGAGFYVISGNIYSAINYGLDVNVYFIVQFLLFILDLAITIPIVAAVASYLGGSLRLSLTKRLKLV